MPLMIGCTVPKLIATCFEQLPSIHGWRLLRRAAVQRLRAGRRSPWAVIVIAVVIITASITQSTREHTFKDLSDSRRLLNVMQCRAMLAHEVYVEQRPWLAPANVYGKPLDGWPRPHALALHLLLLLCWYGFAC